MQVTIGSWSQLPADGTTYIIFSVGFIPFAPVSFKITKRCSPYLDICSSKFFMGIFCSWRGHRPRDKNSSRYFALVRKPNLPPIQHQRHRYVLSPVLYKKSVTICICKNRIPLFKITPPKFYFRIFYCNR